MEYVHDGNMTLMSHLYSTLCMRDDSVNIQCYKGWINGICVIKLLLAPHQVPTAVYVHGFSYLATEYDLGKLFHTCGTISSKGIKIGVNSKGFKYAFVNFTNQQAAGKALALNGVKTPLGILTIRVSDDEARNTQKKKAAAAAAAAAEAERVAAAERAKKKQQEEADRAAAAERAKKKQQEEADRIVAAERARKQQEEAERVEAAERAKRCQAEAAERAGAAKRALPPICSTVLLMGETGSGKSSLMWAGSLHFVHQAATTHHTIQVFSCDEEMNIGSTNIDNHPFACVPWTQKWAC